MDVLFLSGVLAGLVAVVGYHFRALSLSGALATFLMGATILSVGGWLFALPIVLFFVTSSALSRIQGKNKATAQDYVEKSDCRDMTQVLSNGIIPTLFVFPVLLGFEREAFILYSASVAAITADTWASEIGMASSASPRSLLTGATLTPGMSGGVTLPGTLAALAGSGFITVTSAVLASFLNLSIDYRWWLMVGAAGFVGQVVDTVLGATLQQKRECAVCGITTERLEHCDHATHQVGGLRLMTNDSVNVACAAAGAGISGVGLLFFTF